MLKNYFKIAWRFLLHQKGFSFINISGLALGFACFFLIALYVTDELSFDTFHKKSDRIHVVARENQSGDQLNRTMISPLPLAETLKNDLPEIEETVVTNFIAGGAVSVDGSEFFLEDKVYHATEAFFEVFDFPLLAGDPSSVLDEPGSVVLSSSMAQKYFPNENPIGKTITIDRQGVYPYTITGIAQDPPENSFLRFDFLASLFTLENAVQNQTSWNVSSYWVFTLLGEGHNADGVEAKLDYIPETYLPVALRTDHLFMVPLPQVYLTDLVEVGGFKGDIKYIYIFSAIGLFILILAIINYMNLATAQSLRRTVEVGIRKVSGADFKQLVFQYLTESLVIALLGFLGSLLIAEILLNFFNSFFDKNLVLFSLSNLPFLMGMLGVSSLVGILSGLYPAIYLSRFRPVWILKGRLLNATGLNLRKALVVVQFTIAVVLITGTLIMINQLGFILEKDPGYDKEQVMYIEAGYEPDQTLVSFKEISLGHSAVSSASLASGMPGKFYFSMDQSFDPSNTESKFTAYMIRTDTDYAEVLGLEILAGRYFSEERSSDVADVCIINEAFLTKLGWTSAEEAIGRTLTCGEVIGVVRDFHFQSLHSEIAPVFITPSDPIWDRMLAIKFNAADVSGMINYLDQEWKSAAISHLPLTYHFLDDQFAQMHQTDQKMSRAFGLFASISIFIACLGLFGLAAYAAEQRKKEIGIRKILGATLTNILNLLTTDFLKLVAIGFLIAVPVTWIIMQQWLQQFAYRIEMGAGVFILAGFAALLIALLTVSWQAVKTALMNPVKSLRSE